MLKSKFFSNFIHLLSGRSINALLNLLILYVLLISISVTCFGEFTYAISILTAIPILMDLGLNSAFVSIVATNFDKIKHYKSAFFLFKFAMSFLVLFTTLLLYATNIIDTLICYSIISGIALGWSEASYSSLQAQSKFALLARMLTLPNIIKLIFIVVLLFINKLDLNLIILSFGLASIIQLAAVQRFDCIFFKYYCNKQIFSELLSLTRWLFLYNICIMLTMRTEVFFLKYYSSISIISKDELGVYGAAFRLASFFPIVTGTLTSVLLPKVASIKSQAEISAYKSRITKLIFPMLALLLVSSTCISPLINILLSRKYEHVIAIFNILIFGVSVTTFTNSLLLIAYPSNKLQWLSFVIGIQLIANIIFDLILIPNYGSIGAATAMTAVRIIGLLITLYLAKVVFILDKETNLCLNS